MTRFYNKTGVSVNLLLFHHSFTLVDMRERVSSFISSSFSIKHRWHQWSVGIRQRVYINARSSCVPWSFFACMQTQCHGRTVTTRQVLPLTHLIQRPATTLQQTNNHWPCFLVTAIVWSMATPSTYHGQRVTRSTWLSWVESRGVYTDLVSYLLPLDALITLA